MPRLLRLSVFLLSMMAAIASSSASQASAASIRYVTKGGYDGYDCLTRATACGTIDGALYRAAGGDIIEVTAETYYGYGAEVVYVDKDITISGGWDQTFTNRTGRTTIDGQGSRQGFEIIQGVNARIQHFIIQNGSRDTLAGGIVNWGTLIVDNSVVQNNTGRDYSGGGIFSNGTLTVSRSTIKGNIGPGIDSEKGSLLIADSTISNNTDAPGVIIFAENASIINSTISGNINTNIYSYGGGGILYLAEADNILTLRSVTITGNQAVNSGGGIHLRGMPTSQISMANSILAGNTAGESPNCNGPITSQGYNIIGDSTGCTISSTVGDQLNVNPLLSPLTYNGGPTYTHRLIAGSLAIDGGNPNSCRDQYGLPLTTDQRGFPRPLDGNGDGIAVCDVGSYEYDPSYIILSSFLPVVRR